MDDLEKAFNTYRKLLKIEYHITVGKKGLTQKYILCFDKDHFKHIFGFHKLKDNEQLYKSASTRLFRDVMTGKITQQTLEKSQYYSDIENRLQNIEFLEKYLDSFQEFYRWDSKKSLVSNISANIMIANCSEIDKTKEVFIFFNKCNNGKMSLSVCIEEQPVSIIQTQLNYRQGQERQFAILLIEKYNTDSKDKLVLFKSSNFEQDKSAMVTNFFS